MSRYPWRDTSTDIAGGQPPQWETPQGAQKKADDALKESKDYTDEQNVNFNAHIEDTTIHVTPADKANWNSKAPGVHTHANATPIAPGFMSAEDKVKLNGVEAEANKYVHPASHPPAIIAQDTGNRFVSDAEKAAWNGKAEPTEATTTVKGLMSPADKQKLNGIQAAAEVNQNAFSGVNGIVATSKSDTLQLTGGTGITITEDPATKRLIVTATGDATPGAHASSHLPGGTDVIPDAVTGGLSGLMSGADAKFVRQDGETKTGAQAKADAAEQAANEYTDQKVGEIVIDDASLTKKGIVQLSKSTTGDRDTVAATESAVGAVQQQVGNLSDLQTTDKDNLVDALNEVFTHVGDGKNLIESAVIVKGGTVAGTSPHSFAELADGIQTISTATVIRGQQKSEVLYTELINANDPIYTINQFSENISLPVNPTGTGRSTAISLDGKYMVIGHDTSPFISIYKIENGIVTKLPNPSVLPTDIAFGVAISPDGSYLAVAQYSAPYLILYKRNGDTFTKLPNPAVLPTGAGRAIAFSFDGSYLAIGHDTSPFITIYKRDGDVFTKLVNPSTLPAGGALCVAFSWDNVYLTVGHVFSPFITIYKRDGDTFSKMANPVALPPSAVSGVSFDPSDTGDSRRFAVTHNFQGSIKPVSIYRINSSGSIDSLGIPGSLPNANAIGIAYSADGGYFAVGYNASPWISLYERVSTTYKLDQLPNVVTGMPLGIAFGPTSDYLSIAHINAPFATLFKKIKQAHKSNNNLSDSLLGKALGYALESGLPGEKKDAILIWRA